MMEILRIADFIYLDSSEPADGRTQGKLFVERGKRGSNDRGQEISKKHEQGITRLEDNSGRRIRLRSNFIYFLYLDKWCYGLKQRACDTDLRTLSGWTGILDGENEVNLKAQVTNGDYRNGMANGNSDTQGSKMMIPTINQELN